MKFLAFDIETYKMTPDGEKWEDHRPLGISCVGTYLEGTDDAIVWYSGMTEAMPAIGDETPENRPMNKTELNAILNYMICKVGDGFTILSWNGVSFDFRNLLEEANKVHLKDFLVFDNHVDMMLQFLAIKGYPLGLDVAAKGMGLSGKTEGMSGDLAPDLWQSSHEDRLKVLEYVAQDALTTFDVADKIRNNQGVIKWTSKKGRPMTARVGPWLSVREAIRLPLPDTSWMTTRLTRETLTEWTT